MSTEMKPTKPAPLTLAHLEARDAATAPQNLVVRSGLKAGTDPGVNGRFAKYA